MGLYATARAPYVTPERGSVGAARTPLALGARRWWTADSGHDQSATIAAWRDVLAGAELTAAGSARPSYGAALVGGRPAVSFDGVAEYMTIAGGAAYDMGAACTVYAVFAASGTTGNASICARYSTTAANALWWFQIHAGADTDDGASAISETGTHTTRFSATSTSQDLSTGSVVDAMMLWDGANITHYKGATAATPAACAGAKSVDATPLEVGRIALASPMYATMDLRHLLIFGRALGSVERAALRAWATADCGVVP